MSNHHKIEMGLGPVFSGNCRYGYYRGRSSGPIEYLCSPEMLPCSTYHQGVMPQPRGSPVYGPGNQSHGDSTHPFLAPKGLAGRYRTGTEGTVKTRPFPRMRARTALLVARTHCMVTYLRIGEAKVPGPIRPYWESRGFSLHPIPGDGQCLYAALGFHVGKTAHEVRYALLTHLHNDLHNGAHDPHGTLRDETVAQLGDPQAWGGAAQIHLAATLWG